MVSPLLSMTSTRNEIILVYMFIGDTVHETDKNFSDSDAVTLSGTGSLDWSKRNNESLHYSYWSDLQPNCKNVGMALPKVYTCTCT